MKAKELRRVPIYALYDPKGMFIQSGNTMSEVTNYWHPDMTPEMRSTILRSKSWCKTAEALRAAGYHIVRCRLIPMTNVRIPKV